MSPPCQPYTRGGKLLDDQDNRAKPLLHLLDQLEKMTTPPTYLFLENVKNFETSRSRERLVTLLHKMGYVFRECLLAPHNFGVPNDRLRYFLMARLRSSFEHQPSSSPSSTQAEPFHPDTEIVYTTWPFPAFVEDPKTTVEQHPFHTPTLEKFLDKDEVAAKDYLLSRQLILERPNFRFDILRPSSNRSSCFTKAYGSHHVASGGGLLQTSKMDQQDYDFGNSESIAELDLRFFTPTEVARLHVFPLEDDQHEDPFKRSDPEPEQSASTLTTTRPFNPRQAQSASGPFLKFPEKLKALQRYKLLGNSLNVWVVAELLRGILFADHPGVPQPTYRQLESCAEQMACTIPESLNNKHAIENEKSAIPDSSERDTKKAKVE
ncbi:tRNA (cytosine-5-)-methyltransferase [Mortierella alpina]|nr:tRNA (cytosine-5-)-methyltransferase [Mortierella alpina]